MAHQLDMFSNIYKAKSKSTEPSAYNRLTKRSISFMPIKTVLIPFLTKVKLKFRTKTNHLVMSVDINNSKTWSEFSN